MMLVTVKGLPTQLGARLKCLPRRCQYREPVGRSLGIAEKTKHIPGERSSPPLLWSSISGVFK